TAWRRPDGGRSSATSITWRRSSAPPGTPEAPGRGGLFLRPPTLCRKALWEGCMNGLHAAIIMDGNGRWALTRGRSRMAGHEAGVAAVRRTVEAAPDLGIAVLTLFAFSSDNWKRPPEEVGALLRLFRTFLVREARRAAERGARIAVLGRRDRLPGGLVRAIESAEAATARAGPFLLRIAIDYSAPDANLRPAPRPRGYRQPRLPRRT